MPLSSVIGVLVETKVPLPLVLQIKVSLTMVMPGPANFDANKRDVDDGITVNCAWVTDAHKNSRSDRAILWK